MDISRRRFVTSSLTAGTLSMLPFRFAPSLLNNALAATDEANPLQVLTPGAFSSREFNGDEIERTHQILWNIDGYVKSQGGWPAPSEDVPVAIIGGGMAGLYATYLLRDLNPVLLEQDRAFGGNSKGERIGETRASIGAAYIVEPKRDSDDGRMLAELGLWNAARRENGHESTVFMKNRFVAGFWQGSTDPAARQDFERVFATLNQILKKIENDEISEEQQAKLDAIPFETWMRQGLGPVHPHIHEYFQLYAWSSFAASLDELSTWQMLGFIAAETGTLLAFPGGNAAITARLYERVVGKLGRNRIRSNSLVIDVQVKSDHVLISYADAAGRLRALRARAAIFAAPKFVAKRVIRALPGPQAKAMSMISYRGYVVANIFLDRPVRAPSFELYHLEGAVPPSPTAIKPSPRPFTDICFGSWAQNDRATNPVLTVYKAFAFDGDRQFLFNPAAHDKHRNRIVEGIRPLLKEMKLDISNIKGVRMTRWGHSMPVASAGLISRGVVQAAHQPIQGRLFFANQDNWANPSFETATEEARNAAAAVRRLFR